MPVDALLGARALEAALEARAGAELLEPAEDPQLRDQLVRVVHHRRAGEAELQRVLGQRLGEPADGAGALGRRVLDVVGLVEDQRLGPRDREPLAVRVHDLVVEDRDVGLRDRLAGADDDVQRAVRQPVLGLALPVELQRRRADDDRRVGVVLLQRGQRLDGLAQALLVGDEQPPRLERVARRRRAGTGRSSPPSRGPRRRARRRRPRASGGPRRSRRRARSRSRASALARVVADVDRRAGG